MAKKTQYYSAAANANKNRGDGTAISPGRRAEELANKRGLTEEELEEIKEAFDLFD
jgi:Ca2+-binding EF-hand superfamily protein